MTTIAELERKQQELLGQYRNAQDELGKLINSRQVEFDDFDRVHFISEDPDADYAHLRAIEEQLHELEHEINNLQALSF